MASCTQLMTRSEVLRSQASRTKNIEVPSVSVEDLERSVAEAERKEELLERKLEMMSQEVQEYPVSFMG